MKSNYLQVNNTPKKALTHVTGEFIIEIRKVGPDGQELEPKPSSSGSVASSKTGQKKIPMTYTAKQPRARRNEVSGLLKKHDDNAMKDNNQAFFYTFGSLLCFFIICPRRLLDYLHEKLH